MKQLILLTVLLFDLLTLARTTDVYTNHLDGVEVLSEYKAHDNLDYGIPSTNVDVIVDRDGYAIGFSNEHKQPVWASYRLTASELSGSTVKRTGDFRTDTLLSASSTPKDYNRSGYDKGHIVPAADLSYSSWTMHNSFLMSNMSPQVGELNRESWRMLETWVRETALREKSIVVVTGPIFPTNVTTTIGVSNVTVPDAYYKAILDETAPCKVIAFVLENKALTNDVRSHVVPITELEARTHLHFFTKFPNIETLKKSEDTTQWTW